MRRLSVKPPALAALLLGATPLVSAVAPSPVDVDVTVTGLRSARGQMLACLTARPQTFPDCNKDPQAFRRTVPVGAATVRFDFGLVPEGRFAIALVHDENGNGRMDKRLMLPSEGFGFSRDAPLRFGPPSFGSAAFQVDPATEHQAIRMRYMF